MDLIKQLQTVVAPQIFTPRGVYDGRKNIFAAREFPFGETHTKEESILSSSGAHYTVMLNSSTLNSLMLVYRTADRKPAAKVPRSTRFA